MTRADNNIVLLSENMNPGFILGMYVLMICLVFYSWCYK